MMLVCLVVCRQAEVLAAPPPPPATTTTNQAWLDSVCVCLPSLPGAPLPVSPLAPPPSLPPSKRPGRSYKYTASES